jgi:hypothetical protein
MDVCCVWRCRVGRRSWLKEWGLWLSCGRSILFTRRSYILMLRHLRPGITLAILQPASSRATIRPQKSYVFVQFPA